LRPLDFVESDGSSDTTSFNKYSYIFDVDAELKVSELIFIDLEFVKFYSFYIAS